MGTHWTHAGHLDHGQRSPVPGITGVTSVDRSVPALMRTRHHHTAAISHHLPSPPLMRSSHRPQTITSSCFQEVSHPTLRTPPAAGVTTSHWSLPGTVPHHQHHLQGVGVLVITTTVCGDGDHCGPALCSVDTNPILPGGWLVARPATTGQVATNQGPSLSALSVFPLAAPQSVVPQCGH